MKPRCHQVTIGRVDRPKRSRTRMAEQRLHDDGLATTAAQSASFPPQSGSESHVRRPTKPSTTATIESVRCCGPQSIGWMEARIVARPFCCRRADRRATRAAIEIFDPTSSRCVPKRPAKRALSSAGASDGDRGGRQARESLIPLVSTSALALRDAFATARCIAERG